MQMMIAELKLMAFVAVPGLSLDYPHSAFVLRE